MFWNVLLLLFVLGFAWEHIARINRLSTRPSVALTRLAHWCTSLFEWCGRGLAHLSSFYEYIYEYLRLEEIGKTLYALLVPLWRTLTSPFWMVKGYVETMNLYDHPYLISLGSATLLGGISVWVYVWKFKG